MRYAHNADKETPHAQQTNHKTERDAHGAHNDQTRSRAPIVTDRRSHHTEHRRAKHHVNGDAAVFDPTTCHAAHRTHSYCLAIVIRPKSSSTPGPVTSEMPHAVGAGS